MADYRRWYIPGGTYFFTLVTYQRRPLFQDGAARRLLGDLMREQAERTPFDTVAVVLLWDHLHCLWTLPPGDNDYSRRWKEIKAAFTRDWLRAGGEDRPVSCSKARAAGGGFGNLGSMSTPFAMSETWRTTPTISISIQSNMDMQNARGIGSGCPFAVSQDWGSTHETGVRRVNRQTSEEWTPSRVSKTHRDACTKKWCVSRTLQISLFSRRRDRLLALNGASYRAHRIGRRGCLAGKPRRRRLTGGGVDVVQVRDLAHQPGA